jgi:hypothetical protein
MGVPPIYIPDNILKKYVNFFFIEFLTKKLVYFLERGYFDLSMRTFYKISFIFCVEYLYEKKDYWHFIF